MLLGEVIVVRRVARWPSRSLDSPLTTRAALTKWWHCCGCSEALGDSCRDAIFAVALVCCGGFAGSGGLCRRPVRDGGEPCGSLVGDCNWPGGAGGIAGARPVDRAAAAQKPDGAAVVRQCGGDRLRGVAEGYAQYAVLENPGALPGADWAVLWNEHAWPLLFAPVVAIAFMFPDGRLPSQRWRPVAVGVAATFVLALVVGFFDPEPFDSPYEQVENPLPAASGVGWLWPLVMLGGIASLFAAVTAVRVRFRRATGVERLQLKWLAYSSFLIPDHAAGLPRFRSRGPRDRRGGRFHSACLHDVDGRARVGRYRGSSLPPLRHRPADQSHARLRRAHRSCSRRPTAVLPCSSARRWAQVPRGRPRVQRCSSPPLSARFGHAFRTSSIAASAARATTGCAGSRRSSRTSARAAPRRRQIEPMLSEVLERSRPGAALLAAGERDLRRRTRARGERQPA